MSPKNSLLGPDDTMDNFGGRRNEDLFHSPGRNSAREENADPTDPLRFNIRTYGLKQEELERTFIDLEVLDYAFLEWSKDDSRVGELTEKKHVGPKNKDY